MHLFYNILNNTINTINRGLGIGQSPIPNPQSPNIYINTNLIYLK